MSSLTTSPTAPPPAAEAAAPPTVLIPAYRPGPAMLRTLAQLRAARPTWPLVVVDDGTGSAFTDVFDAATALGAEVLTHARNRGKGVALKTGFEHVARTRPGMAVVCADADGQHAPRDIIAVADRLGADPLERRLVLGTRGLDGPIPLRSRLGNDLTRWLFTAATHLRLSDTQTGLRGIPPGLLSWATRVPGDRYDYELQMLLRAARAGIGLDTVPIDTIYLDHNSSSHFRPVVDSLRVYVPLVLFLASSLATFAVDTVALLLLEALTGDLLLSVVGARLTSAGINFAVNRRVVFDPRRRCRTGPALGRYAALAAVLLVLNYLTLRALTQVGLDLLPAKLLTELGLVSLSFAIQRRIVFAAPSQRAHKVMPPRQQVG
ncbi:bifunctional glycosyltransferase family 2/GtrA family protein [Nocardioides flavus (ex Wang et al. 2016)]|nr:bifunctional glycosyltransferase family 2/GtrA family protein [Nocardioides flavus (ex Wang et al. 2016)]